MPITRIRNFVSKLSRITKNGDTDYRVEVDSTTGDIKFYHGGVLVGTFDADGFHSNYSGGKNIFRGTGTTSPYVTASEIPEIALPPKEVKGFTVVNTSTQLTIDKGWCRDKDNSKNLYSAQYHVKSLSAWAPSPIAVYPAVPAVAGGLAAGVTLSNGMWLNVWAIGNATSGVCDIGIDDTDDASKILTTPAVVAANLTKAQLIYKIHYIDGTSFLVPSMNDPSDPDKVIYTAKIKSSDTTYLRLYLNPTAAGYTGPTLFTVLAPKNTYAITKHFVHKWGATTGGWLRFRIYSPYETDLTNAELDADYSSIEYLYTNQYMADTRNDIREHLVNSSSQLKYHISSQYAMTYQVFITSLGYRWKRGI